MHREVTITPDAPMPQGYAFLPKGIVFKTFHCRKLTRESGRTLYVVTNNKNTLGLRAPKAIIAQVHSTAKDTLATRRAAVQKKDAADIDKATGELRDQFPKMPKIDKDLILCHGFRKHSGRVGRNGSMALSKKVTLAVIAHIRHRHTDYDALLRHGQAREATRKAIWKQIENTMRKWGCTDDLSWYFGDDTKKGKKSKQQRREDKQDDWLIALRCDRDDHTDADYVP